MKHSIAAYLARLPREKAELLWKQWVLEDDFPAHLSPVLLEILRVRLETLAEEEKTP